MNSSKKDPFQQSGSFEGASGSFNQKSVNQSGSGKNFDPLGLANNPKNDFLSPSFASSKPKAAEPKSSLFAPKAVQQETKLTSLANLPPPIVQKAPVKVATGFDDGWDDADWNFDDADKEEVPDFDINDKSYQKKNLNKLGDKELAAEKRKMDKKFDQNFVKPTDAGYEYDKVVDFKNQPKDEVWGDGSDEDYSDDWS